MSCMKPPLVMNEAIRSIPWDSEVFGIPCFELGSLDEDILRWAQSNSGHYTVKVDPLADKAVLYRYGFYYVDTLLSPRCNKSALRIFRHPDCRVVLADEVSSDLLEICADSFLYGRFHRDFQIDSARADKRYQGWLRHLSQNGQVYSLLYQEKLAGFIACQSGMLVLHAMKEEYRGRGLARFFWSEVCSLLVKQGAQELYSSVSAANLAVINLYASLGFRFCTAVDVYHRITQ